MNDLLALGVIGGLGAAGGVAVRRLGLPAITGYLIVGIAIGPSALDVISSGTSDNLSGVITPLALGVIAYMIGGSLPLSKLRGLRGSIASIAVFQSICPWLLVVALVTLLGPVALPGVDFDRQTFFAMAILAGAISLATAPAATLALVEEAKSKGPLTTTLLAVVALDDGLAVIGYAIAAGAAAILLDTADSLSPGLFLLEETVGIGLSGLFGLGFALPLILLSRVGVDRPTRLVITITLVVLSAGLAEYLDLLPVITNMVLGFAVVNAPVAKDDVVDIVHEVEGLVFILFFTLAGTHLDLDAGREAAALAGLIIVGRAVGKYAGVWIGSRLSGAQAVVRRYLGIALLPQAGITVGLALLIVETPELEPIATLLVGGVLVSTLVNELLAPPAVKFVLSRAGEAGRGA